MNNEYEVIVLIMTCCHPVQRARYQAVEHLAFDPLRELLVFLLVLRNMHQHLSEHEAAQREGMDEQGARDEALALKQVQQTLPMIQTPARPQELFDLV